MASAFKLVYRAQLPCHAAMKKTLVINMLSTITDRIRQAQKFVFFVNIFVEKLLKKRSFFSCPLS